MNKLWRFVFGYEMTVVRVKSLLPVWDSHERAIGWPTLLIDRKDGQRETVTRIWKRKDRTSPEISGPHAGRSDAILPRLNSRG
jgi:hypothetical protein